MEVGGYMHVCGWMCGGGYMTKCGWVVYVHKLVSFRVGGWVCACIYVWVGVCMRGLCVCARVFVCTSPRTHDLRIRPSLISTVSLFLQLQSLSDTI